MKRIKATLLDRWAKLTNIAVRQEPSGEWVRSDREPRKPNVVTAAVSKRYGQQRVIADVDDIGVLNFIVAARTAMPQLIDTLRLYERALDDVQAIIALRREMDDRESGPLLGELERVLAILDVPNTVGTRAAPARPQRAASRPRAAAARRDARTVS